jgi:hypothetical protein
VRVLDQTLADVRIKFADLSPEVLQALIDEALSSTRQANTPKPG